MTKPRPGVTLLLAGIVIFALAPAAAAQLPSDPVGTIGDTLDGGGSDGGAGDAVGDAVGDVKDTVGGGDEGSSQPSGETNQGDDTPIAGVTDKVKDTVNKPEDKPEETVNAVEDPGGVGGTVGGVVDGAVGGIAETGNAAANDVNELTKNLTGKGAKKAGDATVSNDGVTTGSGRYAAAAGRSHDKVFAQSLAARRADAKNRTPIRLSSATTTPTNEGSGVIQQIGRVAAEAAQQAAFPLVLTLLVGAFLIGQNRIDRRDPKLAMAPIDSEQDLLSFS